LRDIAQKNYRSLFDSFYLKMLRDLHRKYGVKFSLNIYYTTGDDFKLLQFSDRYKSEWRDNAHWMKLTFHAYANNPGRPYEDAPPEKLLADLDLVASEIRRFAGEETYVPPTIIHWGMTRPSGAEAVGHAGRAGIERILQARRSLRYQLSFERRDFRVPMDSRRVEGLQQRIVFSRVDIICNMVPLNEIVSVLEPQINDPNTAEIIDLLTHEQYFWKFDEGCYLPDHPQRNRGGDSLGNAARLQAGVFPRRFSRRAGVGGRSSGRPDNLSHFKTLLHPLPV